MSVFFISPQALAYGVETHGLLTKEVVSFYNTHFSSPISKNMEPFLIDGAMHEDTNPRYLNHFYDPVNDRGLADGIYKGQGSKYWAQDEDSQTALKYKLFAHTADSILTADQFSKVDSVYYKTNFTWQKAIDLYAQGKNEEAFFALGHVLHLIEDAAVPDHTRNDAHPAWDDGGSPYENWTKKFSLDNSDPDLSSNLKTKRPILLADLNSYFDSMSDYSNNNFYSRDSIDSYDLPKPDYFKKIDGKNFGFKIEKELGDYMLIFVKGNLEWKNSQESLIDNSDVLTAYWSRLSVKAVQHGAGVVNLFFREGKKAKEKLAREKASRPYLATLMDGFSGLFGKTIEVEPPGEIQPQEEDKSPASEETGQSTSDAVPLAPVTKITATPRPITKSIPSPSLQPENFPRSEETRQSASDVVISTPTLAPASAPSNSSGQASSPQATPIFVVNSGGGSGGGGNYNNTPTPEPTPPAVPESTPEPTPTPSPSPIPISTPSVLESGYFYKNPQDEKYYLSLSWKEYPFISKKFGHLVSGEPVGHNWHAVLFYYNVEASETDDLFWINYNDNAAYKSWSLIAPNGLRIKYPNCQSTETAGSSLILPDATGDCSGLAGNHASFAFDINKLEDNNLLVEVIDDKLFSPSLEGPIPDRDYVSLAYYSYQPGYEPNNYGLRLVSVDPLKYYFQNNSPTTQAPTKPSSISFDFNEATSRLKVTWEKSTDLDTLDNLLAYEIAYNGNLASVSTSLFELSTEPAATYSFEITAIDDWGNKSELASASYTTPDLPLPYELANVSWGLIDNLNRPTIKIEFPNYPFINPEAPGAMMFFLNQNSPAGFSFLDSDYRDANMIGGSHTVLKLDYPICDYGGTWDNPVGSAALVMHNGDCPIIPRSIFMSTLSLAKLSSVSVEFSADVAGVVSNGQSVDSQFTENDYLTIGFYELGSRDGRGRAYFQNAANYNKKIYFEK